MKAFQTMAVDGPGLYLIGMAKPRRISRIFLDYLGSDRMAAAVTLLSPRGRRCARLSLQWIQNQDLLTLRSYRVGTGI